MSHSNSSGGSSLPIAQEQPSVIPWLREQIKIASGQNEIISELSQIFQIVDFQLGDLISSPWDLSASQNQEDLSSLFLYLVCQGKVRLLSFSPSRQKPVSIQLLKNGETFGGDSYYCRASLSYQAIAASKVTIAKVSLNKLKPWLEKFPELEQSWSVDAKHRQCLLFFKSLSLFCNLPTHKLQQFCGHLAEKTIAPGEYLAQVNPQAGRFWLRQGEIQNQACEPGLAWGYPEPTTIGWVSKTELLTYYLPQANWEVARAISPVLANLLGASIQSPQTGESNSNLLDTSSTFSPQPDAINSHPMKVSPPYPSQVSLPNSSGYVEQEVDFPKPLKRKFQLWQSYPFIQQQSSSDCGVACLAMISQYWGKRFGINSLRELIGVDRSGASLKGLAKGAESLGYQARPVRASLSRLVDQKNPWIAHWEGNHYIVVYWIKGDQVFIADPDKGKYQLSRQEFLASWTGYGLLLDPTERLSEMPEEKRSLGRFFNLLVSYRSLGLQIILASFLIQIFGLVLPLFTQIILDQVVVNRSQSTLNIFVIGALMFGIGKIVLSSVREYLLSYLANRLDLTMISGFIKHALTLPLKFFESRRVGDIITRVQENQKIQRFLIGQVLLSWLDLVSGFVYLCLMLYYNWQLTVIILAIIPPIVILTLVATPLLRKISRERFNAEADQNSSLVEMMTGISTVKTVAAEQDLRWRWEDNLTHQLNVRFKGQKLAINLGFLSGLINSIGSLVILWYGANLIIQNQLTIGQFVAFNMMMGHVISPVTTLVGLWDELQEVLISVERLNDVFDQKSEEPSQSSALVLPRLQGNFELDNVTFRYDTEQEHNAIQNISLKVKRGQTIAIVGRSGSGKSTLVKLLQGLYYPSSGQLLVDGHQLQHLSLQSLRSQLGVVPQDCFLFSGTIAENITLHRPGFTLEQVIETAQLAEAHPFIQAMPLGYKTKVGERGSNLSGGQRQRIAIARALLGEPAVLILDEATSSLDTESERRFQENLTRLSRERTTFVIAHRLSTVRNADCIIVLDKGNLVEKGTHEQLIAQQGLYYHLAQQQLDL
ncbi:ABC-type bacteriocin transporter [Xenococcus sp. PCC 7305]|uniref:peptide cleavage/export ABC transporter n=1 Tax=Xenococcus sp. PCC 7305 TaxID=102125 RepID=UPI0002ACAAB5|nr:peptide cleavage/export ABC transporter [Xenococcus sp. PCC 7305]ELS03808.1 ABC-type bacteriocin transporter [Xenococcus sp. PCC 7305]